MALPNPGLDAVPFTPLPAEFLDKMNQNIESLANGTGFNEGAIPATAFAGGKYSETETPIGTWIDGRTVYRKVVITTMNLVSGADIWINHGITGLTNKFLLLSMQGCIVFGGQLNNSAGKSTLYHLEAIHHFTPLQINSTQIRFYGTFSWGSSGICLVLVYVK